MAFFVIFLSPLVEYVDPDNAGWDRGFGPFVLEIWWPPAPGPTWFLAVLLVFSTGYAVVRTRWPRRETVPAAPRPAVLVGAAVAIAAGAYAIRLVVPLGTEVWRLALGQSPGWVVGFVLGVLGGEGGWFERRDVRVARTLGRVAWVAAASTGLFIAAGALTGVDIELYAGGGTWQSLVTAVLEGALIVAMSLWLIDLFQRRFGHQGALAHRMSRSAYAAFVFHQVILVGLVLVSHRVPWPPEVKYLLVGALGVVVSFWLGSLVVRLPGLSRIV
jgi:hypothetical protein